MAEVFPTYNDVGAAGKDRGTEENISAAFHRLTGQRAGIVEGFAPTNPSGLTVRVAAGSCIINGYMCEVGGTTDATATDDATSYQHLHLTRDGSDLVTGVELATLSSISTDPDYLLVTRVVCSSGVMTHFYDERESQPGAIVGTYTGDGTTNRDIDLGRTPSFVIVGCEDNGYAMMGMSQIDAPGNRRGLNAAEGLIIQSRLAFADGIKTLEANAAQARFGSDTWNSGSVSAHAQINTDVTVTGVAATDVVVCCHSAPGVFTFEARYLSTNTVRVYATNASGGTDSFTGTIYIVALRTTSIAADCEFVESGSANSQAPVIVEDGFRVSSGSFPALNNTALDYNYIAFF